MRIYSLLLAAGSIVPAFAQTSNPDAKEWLYNHSVTTETNYNPAGSDVPSAITVTDLKNTRDDNGNITGDESLANKYVSSVTDDPTSSVKTTHSYDSQSRVVDEAQYVMPDNKLVYHNTVSYSTVAGENVAFYTTYYDVATGKIVRRKTDERSYDSSNRLVSRLVDDTEYKDGEPSTVDEKKEYTIDYDDKGNVSAWSYKIYGENGGSMTSKYTDIVWGGPSKGEPEFGSEDWFEWFEAPSLDLSAYCGVKSYHMETYSGSYLFDVNDVTIEATTGEYAKYVQNVRHSDGSYGVIETTQTDKWGGYTQDWCSYNDVPEGGKPTDGRLTNKFGYMKTYSDKDNYEYWVYDYDIDADKIVKQYGHTMSVDRDATNGYITKTTEKDYKKDGGELKLQKTIEVVFDNYKQYTLATSISSVSTGDGASATKRVYTIDGVYAGNSLEGLAHGMYIVKEGSKSRKVVK